MIKRIVFACVLFILLYAGLIWLQVFLSGNEMKNAPQNETQQEVPHKVYSFSFSKYTPDGHKQIEIEGDSANILDQNVLLSNRLFCHHNP